MLGIMNSPVEDTIVFASPPQLSTRITSDPNAGRVFLDVKKKSAVSYTQDGRRVVNGVLEENEVKKPTEMWSDLLRRFAVTQCTEIKKPNKSRAKGAMVEEEKAKSVDPNEAVKPDDQLGKKPNDGFEAKSSVTTVTKTYNKKLPFWKSCL